MAYLDRIAEANAHDLGRYVPWAIDGQRVGWLRRDRLARAAAVAPFLVSREGMLQMAPALADHAARTRAMATCTAALRANGEIRPGTGERYPVKTGWSAAALLDIDRAAVPWFGVQAFGVHVNGYVPRDGDLWLWIARRARDKPTYPGLLDNTVAGGQPVGLSLRDNVVKECAEEAGIPRELAARAVAVGAVTYCHEGEGGLKPDCMFCYDLELPSDFMPQCVDGEVEAFELRPWHQVAEIVCNTRDFKFNSSLVVLDFLVRHGLIEADTPDYVEIWRGLRQWGGR